LHAYTKVDVNILSLLQEKLHVEQFIDRDVPETEPVRPADVEDTPFTLVEDLKGLTELVNKLKDVTEFAVSICNYVFFKFQINIYSTCLLPTL
jgi:exosome complex exonuclease RRP6